MIKRAITAVFGSRHVRERKRLQPIVDEINEIYADLPRLSDDDLKAQTPKFRALIEERTRDLRAQIDELKQRKFTTAVAAERESIDRELTGTDGRGGLEAQLRATIAETLEEILPEAFATVREACRRLVGTTVIVTGHEMEWNMIPYDVQLIGGIQLHRGRIAEMATGEGKTLVATLPLYLNALPGRGAHLVTVNSYLARRDSQWMGHVFSWLGLKVGCIDDSEPHTAERRAAYESDITYGTNNEFGFDYLRDNMSLALDQRVQRGHIYAIVDEVDSVLVDEARTPLIISGPVGNSSDGTYAEHNSAVARLVRKQTDIANQLVGDGERALEEKDEHTAAMQLYKARLGAPKNKRLMKVLQEQGVLQLVQKMELSVLADRKLGMAKREYADIEEDLLFVLDEKGHTVHLTDRGVDFIAPQNPQEFVLPDISSQVHILDRDPDLTAAEKLARRADIEREYALKSEKLTTVHQLLRAHSLYERDVDYVVQEGQVLIVDTFTGRTMPGRRWSEGLHQAVEAKEQVQVKGETQTMATITIQNYFRMYEKLAGMTGTAETEESEFHQIYSLDVAVVPTNKAVIRDDRQDLIFKTRREKYNAILEETQRLHALGFPVLVGTVSVDVSETLARMFKRAGITHNVLNAKHHQREAEIVAEAGQPGAVTIATNMAGRGTDIKLGPGVTISKASVVKDPDGKELEVEELGGLHIIGSERHESRRIDRQLRGRAGRQGDPGASQFFLSLEDDLMRLFGSERIARLMDSLGAQEGEMLTHPMITRSIEQAQKRVELQNFQSRKRLLDYDDVMNQQREVIYSLRAFALEGGEELKGEALGLVEKALARRVETNLLAYDTPEDWDYEVLSQDLLMHYLVHTAAIDDAEHRATTLEGVREAVVQAGRDAFDNKMKSFGENADRVLSLVTLNVLDEKWKDHLYDLDQLRGAIHYRSWGQKDPLIEYKHDAYAMFVELMHDIAHTFAERFLRVQLMPAPQAAPPPPQVATRRYNALGLLEDIPDEDTASRSADDNDISPPSVAGDGKKAPPPQIVGPGISRAQQNISGAPGGAPRDWSNVGRNDPCPCGSGKKFKKCHGAS